jgi:hypothetical protein
MRLAGISSPTPSRGASGSGSGPVIDGEPADLAAQGSRGLWLRYGTASGSASERVEAPERERDGDVNEKVPLGDKSRTRKERKHGTGDGSSGRSGGQKRPRVFSAAHRRRVEEKILGKKGDRTRLRLEERLRLAHGTPNFHRTFREYVKEVGMPQDVNLLVVLLDLDEERSVLQVIEAIEVELEAATLDQRSLLRSRLRNLEMSTASDRVADAASSLLARI